MVNATSNGVFLLSCKINALLAHLVLLSVLLAAISCRGAERGDGAKQDDEKNDAILKEVAKLQETARMATHGALGCGVGSVTLVTSKGEEMARCGLDPIHVFGQKIKVSDIHILLLSRIESNRSGKKGPMSGEVSDLCFICLYTLSLAKDPESIYIITSLLEDRNDVVRGWAAIALLRMANADEKLKKQIKKIEFPQPALRSARSRENSLPSWVIEKIRD